MSKADTTRRHATAAATMTAPLSTARETIGADTARHADALGDGDLGDGVWAGIVLAMADDSITLELLGFGDGDRHGGPVHVVAVDPDAVVRIMATSDSVAERTWSEWPTHGRSAYTPCPAPGCRVTIRVTDGTVDRVTEVYDVTR